MSLCRSIWNGLKLVRSSQGRKWSYNASTVWSCREYSSLPRRFYKKTGILQNEDGTFSVRLDQRVLKTPQGNILKLHSDLLAMAVASEWDAQEEEVQLSTMHLTGLCNTAAENPNKFTKESILEKLLYFLETDTVLYYSHNDEVLVLQKKEWEPVTDWFSDVFSVELKPSLDLEGPSISKEVKNVISEHLLSKYNLPAFHGFLYGVESLKSLLLMLCCVERRLSVSQAVLLSRLEEEYQMGNWGKVEWAHDVNQLDLQSRVAAALVFVTLHSLSTETKKLLASKVSSSNN